MAIQKQPILFVLIALLMMSSSAFACENCDSKSNSSPATDSVANVSNEFEMKIDESHQRIVVYLSGEFNDYTTLALTDHRGSEFAFSFVDNSTNTYYFDLADLEKGSYFLVLNMDEEIRIKRFVL